MGKLFALLAIFRRGAVVADPALWKKGGLALQGAIAALALSLNPILKGAGIDVEISQEVAGAIGIVAGYVASVLFTVATSDKVGLPGLAPAAPDVPPVAGPADGAQDDLYGTGP